MATVISGRPGGARACVGCERGNDRLELIRFRGALAASWSKPRQDRGPQGRLRAGEEASAGAVGALDAAVGSAGGSPAQPRDKRTHVVN